MMNEMAAYWNRNFTEVKKEYQTPSDFAVKAATEMKNKGAVKLLELGPGRGRDTFYFDGLGFDLTAVEISDEMAEILAAKTKGKILNLDFREMDFPENSFDAVYARLSLHYFPDQETDLIFDKIHKTLKPKGLLFVQCKSTQDWEYGMGKKVAEDTFEHGHIRHFFSKEYLRQKAAKFDIVELYDEFLKKDDKMNHIVSLVACK